MPDHFTIASDQMQAISQRIGDLTRWLEVNAPGCDVTQKHLEDGTAERAYWHYGYLCSLRDVVSRISRS